MMTHEGEIQALAQQGVDVIRGHMARIADLPASAPPAASQRILAEAVGDALGFLEEIAEDR